MLSGSFVIPKPLHSKLQESSDSTSKSMNAEIVARLDASFETPEATEDFSVTLDRLVQATEAKSALIAAQNRLLSMSAIFLRMVVERVAESENPVSNRLMALTKQFADSMVHGNLEAAQKPIVEMVELGMKMGILDERGQVKPEHAHQRSKKKP